jgi:hypothetical protein
VSKNLQSDDPIYDAATRETPLGRALRRIAKSKRLTSLDTPVLEDAANEIDELTARLVRPDILAFIDKWMKEADCFVSGTMMESPVGDMNRASADVVRRMLRELRGVETPEKR